MQVLARPSLGKRQAAAESAAPAFEIRRLQTFVEETYPQPALEARDADQTIVIAVTILNPHAKRYSDEIDDLFAIGGSVGKFLGRKLVKQHPDFAVSAWGKAAIVGRAGELEHAVGLTGAGFDAAVRQSLHIASGAIPAQRGLALRRAATRVPLAPVPEELGSNDDSCVELCLPSGPREDEVVVLLAVAGSYRG